MKRILLAGATGYLGSHILTELLDRGVEVIAVARTKTKITISHPLLTIVEAQLTNPESIEGIAANADAVISCVGITRQKDNLTYMDVDYQANQNLLDEALASGVEKFIYVSVLNGQKLRKLKICEAKEKFADSLKASGLDYTVVRPNGFFSDMGDFLKMAKGGKVYLFGDGNLKLNPIHGSDLAKACVDCLEKSENEVNIGGPELLTQNEIADVAFQAYGKKGKIIHLPNVIRKATILLLRLFTSQKTYGPFEFFLTTMAMDMSAPCYGIHKLLDHYKEIVRSEGASQRSFGRS
ncbi:MAG: SDR family oxidoreductase [Opitutales bacterium]|nr:SDR family oxidoreductase [Opitutales bacterium]